MTKYRVGNIIKGMVTGIESYGVFVSFDEYYSGLIHISEISHGFVKNVGDYVKIGDQIYVEVLEIDEQQSQLKLSIKNINYKVVKKFGGKKIKETKTGFRTLEYKLPLWINDKLSKLKAGK